MTPTAAVKGELVRSRSRPSRRRRRQRQGRGHDQPRNVAAGGRRTSYGRLRPSAVLEGPANNVGPVRGFRRGWRPLPPLLVIGVVVLAGCGGGGGGGTTTTAPPPPTSGQAGQGQGQLPAGDGQGGVRLQKIGDFDQPVYVTQPPGDDRDLFVVEQTGRVQVVRDGEPRLQALPRPQRPDHVLGHRAGPALARLRARLPEVGAPVRRLHRHRRRHAGGRVPPLRVGSAGRRPAERPRGPGRGPAVRRTTTAACSCSAPDRPLLYIGLGDGGSEGDPNRTGQDLSTLLGKILRIDPAPLRRDAPTRSRTPTRSSAVRAPGRRSTPTGCATRGASPSTRRPGRWRSATWGRTAGRRSTWSHGARAWARTSAGRPTRGSTASTTTSRPRTRCRRSSSTATTPGCSITGGYVVRDRTLPSLYGRYLYGDFCAGQLRSFTASARPARHRRPRARARGPVAELVRRGRRRPHLRDLARRARLPARARAAELGLAARPIATLARCAAGCIAGRGPRLPPSRSPRWRASRRCCPGQVTRPAPRGPPSAGRRRARRDRGSTRSAASPRRPTSPTLPARLTSSTWSSRAARSGWSTTATSWASPSSTSHGRVSSGGERGLLSIAFDPHYGRNHLFYAYYTNGGGNIEIDEFRAASNTRAPESSRRRVIVIPHPARRTTTAASSSSAPTACSTPPPATAAARATRARTPRTSTSCSASSCGSTPTSTARKPYQVAARQPVRRQGRQKRDLRARPAQPVPVLVRPPPDRDRRRRARTAGRRSTTKAAARLAAPTSAGTTSRATTASTTPATTRRRVRSTATGRRSSSTSTPHRTAPRRGAARSSAATSSATAELHSLRGRYLYADFLQGPAAELRPPPPPRQARPGAGRPRRPPELLRQGSARANLRGLPGWPGVQARAQVAPALTRHQPARHADPVPAVESACDGERHRERGRSPARIARRSPGRRPRASRFAVRLTAR